MFQLNSLWYGAGEMTLELKVLNAIPEDSIALLGTHVVAHNQI